MSHDDDAVFAINPDGSPGRRIVLVQSRYRVTAYMEHGETPLAYAVNTCAGDTRVCDPWTVVDAADLRPEACVPAASKDEAIRILKRIVGQRFPKQRTA